MDTIERKRNNLLYEQHLTNLTLQGKRPATIDAYSRAVRRITMFYDRCSDTLTTADLKHYFISLIHSHLWHTVKLDRNGLQFFYRYTLNKTWQWLDIVKPPLQQKLPGVITPQQVGLLISMTQQPCYQEFILTLYTLGLRLGEGLNLTIHYIDRHPRLLFPGKGKHTDTPMDRGRVQKSMKQVLKDGGINKPLFPHSLRHCFGTKHVA